MQCKIVLPLIVFFGATVLWIITDRWFNYFWPRDVIFGRKPLVGVGNVGLAHHWAIKVGKTWYEIEGTTIEDKGSSNTIALSDGLTSKYGAEPEKVSTLYATKDSLWIFIGFLVLAFGWGLFNKKLWLIISFLVLALILRWALFNEKPGFTDIVGITRRTDGEIKAFNQDFIKDNPTYNVIMSNCQDYVNALTNFLMVEGERKGWLPETETYRQ